MMEALGMIETKGLLGTIAADHAKGKEPPVH